MANTVVGGVLGGNYYAVHVRETRSNGPVVLTYLVSDASLLHPFSNPLLGLLRLIVVGRVNKITLEENESAARSIAAQK
jgi:hypothetical protein